MVLHQKNDEAGFRITSIKPFEVNKMTIEFQIPKGKVSDKLESFMRKEILKMAAANKEISRAEITMKEDNTIIPAENKVCEAALTVFGDTVFSYSRSESFEVSAREVIKALKRLVKEQVNEQKEPPDTELSTVKV
jgi:glycerate-2-kinase